MSGEVMAFLDSNIPLKQVLVATIVIGGAVFSLGQVQQRFNIVENDLNRLREEEEFVATQEQLNDMRILIDNEVETLSERLDNKIQIINEQQEVIHKLELQLTELKIRFEEHTHD